MVQVHTKTVLSLSVLAVVGVGVALGFGVTELTKHAATYEELSLRIGQALSQEAAFLELETALSATADDRTALEALLLAPDETVNFLTLLETIAAEQRVSFETEGLSIIEAEGDELDTLVLQFVSTGAPERIERMVEILETLPYRSSLAALALDWSGRPGTADTELRAMGTLHIALTP